MSLSQFRQDLQTELSQVSVELITELGEVGSYSHRSLPSANIVLLPDDYDNRMVDVVETRSESKDRIFWIPRQSYTIGTAVHSFPPTIPQTTVGVLNDITNSDQIVYQGPNDPSALTYMIERIEDSTQVGILYKVFCVKRMVKQVGAVN